VVEIPCRFKSCFPHSFHGKDLRHSLNTASETRIAVPWNTGVTRWRHRYLGTACAGYSGSRPAERRSGVARSLLDIHAILRNSGAGDFPHVDGFVPISRRPVLQSRVLSGPSNAGSDGRGLADTSRRAESVSWYGNASFVRMRHRSHLLTAVGKIARLILADSGECAVVLV